MDICRAAGRGSTLRGVAPGLPDPVAVTFVSSHAELGGSEAYLARLLEQFGPAWVCEVVGLAPGPFLWSACARPASRSRWRRRRARERDWRWGAWRLRRALRRREPQVVHANGLKAATVCALATAGTGLPVVWMKHDLARDGRPARLLGRRARMVIGVSETVNATFAGARGIDARVVPNGLPDYEIETTAARALLRELVGAEAGTAVVLQVGHLHPGKGQLELVEAAPEVLRAHPGARIAFVGADNRYEPEYGAADAHSRGGAGGERGTELPGPPRRRGRAHRGRPDALAVPSVPHAASGWREGFGLVAAEGMAVGTPVVAYAEDALVEVLGDCGEIVPVGDRAALARALVRVLSDASLADALRRCGRERARRFRLPEAAAAVAALYREAARQ